MTRRVDLTITHVTDDEGDSEVMVDVQCAEGDDVSAREAMTILLRAGEVLLDA
jgi:hypothetical protein